MLNYSFHNRQIRELNIDKSMLETQRDNLKNSLKEVEKELELITKQINLHERFISVYKSK